MGAIRDIYDIITEIGTKPSKKKLAELAAKIQEMQAQCEREKSDLEARLAAEHAKATQEKDSQHAAEIAALVAENQKLKDQPSPSVGAYGGEPRIKFG